MGADFIASAISAWSMAHNPWIPMFLGWGITLLGVLPILALPETKSALSSTKDIRSTHDISDPSSDSEEDFPPPPRRKPQTSIIEVLKSNIKSCFRAYDFILHDKQLLLLLCTFLVFNLSRGTSWFLVQYTSKRYDWTISEANYLVSVKSILTVVLFVAILPISSWYLVMRLGLHTQYKDLILMKASIMFLIVGSLGMGISPSIFLMISSLLVQTLGAGFVFLTRSLMTPMVRRDQVARLYTIIEIMEAIGMILTGPILASFFNWGLELGGPWIGLPWIVICGLFCVTAVAVWTYRLPSTEQRRQGQEL